MTASPDAAPAEPRHRRWWRWLRQVPNWLFAFWIVWLYASAFPRGPAAMLGSFCMILGYYACIWIHELGHAGAALLVRWRVVIFAVRPYAYHLPNRDLARMKADDQAELGGYVFAVPSELRALTIRNQAVVTLGGPVLNILFGAIIVWGALDWLAFSSRWGGPMPNLALGALGFQSLHVGLGALIPWKPGRYHSDGRRLLDLARRRKDWRQGRALVLLQALSAHKLRLAEQPQWLIDAAEAEAGSEDARRAVAAIRIGRMLDSEAVQPSAVRTAIDAYLARYGDSEWLAYCDAYLTAIGEADGARAAGRLWQGERCPGLEPLRLAAEASVSARLGHAPAARAGLDRMARKVAEESSFGDPTFRDIRRRIEAVIA